MSLIEVVNEHLDSHKSLSSQVAKFGVIGINLHGSLGHSIHIGNTENFLKVSEGKNVTIDKSRQDFKDHDVASIRSNGVKYFIMLEAHETKELEELLDE